MRRCLYCFSEYSGVFGVCPVCGNSPGCLPLADCHLRPGVVLKSRYLIGQAAGAGGFGITYRSFDLFLKRTVAVKEFFPRRFAKRDGTCGVSAAGDRCLSDFVSGRERFLKEAKFMSAFGECRRIPSVSDFFEENGTSYIVMELLRGKPVSVCAENGVCAQDIALYAVRECATAVLALHKKGFVHRDVAPDNIFLCTEGEQTGVRLLDFGAVVKSGRRLSRGEIVVKPGYSPPEQYSEGCASPAGDVYSLGASLYALLTGKRPVPADERIAGTMMPTPADLGIRIPERIRSVINRSMNIDSNKRFRDAGKFLEALDPAAGRVSSAAETAVARTPPDQGDTTRIYVLSGGTVTGTPSTTTERLLPGTLLRRRFSVGLGFIRTGALGVYEGEDRLLSKPVRICEFFPDRIARRGSDGLSADCIGCQDVMRAGIDGFSFYASKLIRLSGTPGIGYYSDLFEENGTAYLICESDDGVNLRRYCATVRKRKMRPSEALELLRPAVVAAEELAKKGMIHKNITPDTVFIDRYGNCRLRYFADLCFPELPFEGYRSFRSDRRYSAPEIITGNRRGSAASDLYSLSACAYFLISGKDPPDSGARLSRKISGYSDAFPVPRRYSNRADAFSAIEICRGLNVSPQEREGADLLSRWQKS